MPIVAPIESTPCGTHTGRRDAVDQSPGNAARKVDDGLVLDQKAELVAAEPRDGGADGLEGAEPPRDFDEQHVADAVAVQVIDVAEAVEIDGEQREGRPAGAAPLDGPFQFGDEGGAVEDARQRIDLREKAELLFAIERLVETRGQLAEAAEHDEGDRGAGEDGRGGDDLAARIEETGTARDEPERREEQIDATRQDQHDRQLDGRSPGHAQSLPICCVSRPHAGAAMRRRQFMRATPEEFVILKASLTSVQHFDASGQGAAGRIIPFGYRVPQVQMKRPRAGSERGLSGTFG